ncbi:uncharacterized protein KD926_005924 [Aspergillus affinis]|uniref:uncharacterized protein n=1 Tax=Aspergillus affinis TaxID=1070780 RepID=UPI0022FF0286|nr:uncharacterized protein KD926_005924 [Aspergillus affinis]KAI9045979.1 hypothetical protein KD926_005924 [Aspergillus affinis]
MSLWQSISQLPYGAQNNFQFFDNNYTMILIIGKLKNIEPPSLNSQKEGAAAEPIPTGEKSRISLEEIFDNAFVSSFKSLHLAAFISGV